MSESSGGTRLPDDNLLALSVSWCTVSLSVIASSFISHHEAAQR